MAFRCKKCFRPITKLDAHGFRGKTCKEVPLRRCLNCNGLEDHNKGKQAVCPASSAPHGAHVYDKKELI